MIVYNRIRAICGSVCILVRESSGAVFRSPAQNVSTVQASSDQEMRRNSKF